MYGIRKDSQAQRQENHREKAQDRHLGGQLPQAAAVEHGLPQTLQGVGEGQEKGYDPEPVGEHCQGKINPSQEGR